MANCIQCGRKLPGLSFGKKKCQWCVQYEAVQIRLWGRSEYERRYQILARRLMRRTRIDESLVTTAKVVMKPEMAQGHEGKPGLIGTHRKW